MYQFIILTVKDPTCQCKATTPRLNSNKFSVCPIASFRETVRTINSQSRSLHMDRTISKVQQKPRLLTAMVNCARATHNERKKTTSITSMPESLEWYLGSEYEFNCSFAIINVTVLISRLGDSWSPSIVTPTFIFITCLIFLFSRTAFLLNYSNKSITCLPFKVGFDFSLVFSLVSFHLFVPFLKDVSPYI